MIDSRLNQSTTTMKFTKALFFTRCAETGNKIEQGDLILIKDSKMVCFISSTYTSENRKRKEHQIRCELKSLATNGLDSLEYSQDEIDESFAMLEAMKLNELITLRTKFLNQ